METAVLEALRRLRPGTTVCPGTLARQFGVAARDLRPRLAQLAAEGKIRILQGGRPRELATLRGPYRVGPANGAAGGSGAPAPRGRAKTRSGEDPNTSGCAPGT